MATIRKKGAKYQALIRRLGWPYTSKTFATKKLAQERGRSVEHKMDRGTFLDRTYTMSTTMDDLMEVYLDEVTAKERKDAPIKLIFLSPSASNRTLQEQSQDAIRTASSMITAPILSKADVRPSASSAKIKCSSELAQSCKKAWALSLTVGEM